MGNLRLIKKGFREDRSGENLRIIHSSRKDFIAFTKKSHCFREDADCVILDDAPQDFRHHRQNCAVFLAEFLVLVTRVSEVPDARAA